MACVQQQSGRKSTNKRKIIETFEFDVEKETTSTSAIAPAFKRRAISKSISVKRASTPTTQKALIVVRKGEYELIDHHAFPTLRSEEEVVIRNLATGLNPIDWKTVDYNFCLPAFPWVTGREMAGVVEKVGSQVTTCKPGDRVWTSTYYRDSRAGCFQEFVTVPQYTVLPIPSNMGYESAACLGVAALTSAMTLWKWLCVPEPSTTPPRPCLSGADGYLLVWGGSSVTGQYTIQLAKASHFSVIAVCSEKTKDLIYSLGANHVITRDNRSNQDILDCIRSICGDRTTRAVDLVGTDTAPFCMAALSKTTPSHFVPLAMMKAGEAVPPNVTVHNVEMKRFVLDKESRSYAESLNKLLEAGKLKEPRLEVLHGGLGRVREGLEMVKKGDLMGKKFVVSMAAQSMKSGEEAYA
ncbi:chaperonin 10-like protein [Exophiala viscosa]|uniref:chaperonin 10-like protein n=1 Tax=Exophiala viscosa TaxID=2486360 RepID=UPI002195C8EB|nr:chaperonin 10-like protein [Exophiala viscosa]